MSYSNNIRFLRKSAKLSQEDLAAKLNIKRHTICDWETGRTEPSIAQLKSIAEAFNVTVNHIIGVEKEIYNEDLGFDMQVDYTSFVAKTELEKELMELINSCSEEQLQIINDILKGTKKF